MAELARDEMEELQQQLEAQGEGLKFLLLPKDPLDEKNIMLEVGGSGPVSGWWRAGVTAVAAAAGTT